MRVLISVIVSFIFLNAAVLYSPIKIKHFNFIPVKKLKNPKNIDFNNSLAILSSNSLPFIFDKGLVVITGFGNLKRFILTNQKSLSNINTIANLDFESKILLSQLNSHYKVVNANFDDFVAKKVDAIVTYKDLDNPKIYEFKLKDYGLNFDKYFLVTSKKFINKNIKLVKKINRFFEENFDFNENRIYQTLFITSLYLHKKINFNKILFENYNLKKEKEEIPLIVDTTLKWPPFNFGKNNNLYGIGVDFWKLIAKKANLTYKFNVVNCWSDVLKDIKDKKADLTINTSETKDRKKYAVFSKPYASFPLAVVCRSDENFNSIKDVNSLAVGKNYTAEKLMKKYYPNLNYIETANTLSALKLVKNKKVDCAVDILPVMLWDINKNHLMNMQIAFKTPFKFNVQIMVSKDKSYLIPKINKAINSISSEKREKIINSYIGTVLVNKLEIDWKIIGLIVLVVLIIVGLLIFRIKHLSKEAKYDPLTKLLNRRGVLKELNSEEEGAVLYMDIDHFKNINDTYGHEKGDEVLKKLGKILKKSFRKNDIIGRWGGEEFVVVLPKTDYLSAFKLAEILRNKIEKTDFNGVKATISIGVSEFKNKKEFEEALEKADDALYQAKNSGRNQVKGRQ